MKKTRVKELKAGDVIRYSVNGNYVTPITATVEHVAFYSIFEDYVARVFDWHNDGIFEITDNIDWEYVGGKVSLKTDEALGRDEALERDKSIYDELNTDEDDGYFFDFPVSNWKHNYLEGDLSCFEECEENGNRQDEDEQDNEPVEHKEPVEYKEPVEDDEGQNNDEQQDIINKPNHYTYGNIETIDYIEQVTASYKPNIAFLIGNVIKYVSRAPFKNGLEDLKKANYYLDRAIDKWED